MNRRLIENLIQRSSKNELCHFLPVLDLRPIACYKADTFPSVPIIEIKGGLATLPEFQIPIAQRSTINHLDPVLIAGAAFGDAVQVKALLLYRKNLQRFRSSSHTDGKARAVVPVQLAGFLIKLMNIHCLFSLRLPINPGNLSVDVIMNVSVLVSKHLSGVHGLRAQAGDVFLSVKKTLAHILCHFLRSACV